MKQHKDLTIPIHSVTPFTMLDYPDHCAAIVWLSGCNMRCGYCHNPQIVYGKGQKKLEDVLTFLVSRRGLLDAVVLSGGEASAYPDLIYLLRHIKEMGFKTKIDTNGLNPDRIANFLDQNLLDYVALDYKAPKHKFYAVTKTRKFDQFNRTLALLCDQNRIPVEIRTTAHTDLLDEFDIQTIMQDLKARSFTGSYFIQNYQASGTPTLGNLPDPKRPFDPSKTPAVSTYTVGLRNFPAA